MNEQELNKLTSNLQNYAKELYTQGLQEGKKETSGLVQDFKKERKEDHDLLVKIAVHSENTDEHLERLNHAVAKNVEKIEENRKALEDSNGKINKKMDTNQKETDGKITSNTTWIKSVSLVATVLIALVGIFGWVIKGSIEHVIAEEVQSINNEK